MIRKERSMPVGEDFIGWMKNQVAQWADRYNTNPRRAFPAWALNFIFEVEDDDAYNQTDTLSRGDAGLDGWYFDRNSDVFHLVQAKYLDDPIEGRVSPGDLDPLIKAALLLRDPVNIEDGPHRDQLTAIAIAMEQALLDDVSISLDFLIAGRLSDQAATHLEQAAQQLPGNYTAVVYDAERLYQLRLSDDPIEDLAEQSVRFVVSGHDEYFKRAPDPVLPGVKAAAVTALDGRSLADAVEAHGPRLFHGNVRYYLRRSNRVNKSMLQTLETEEGRTAFWLYNNGLTIVADNFHFEKHDGSRVLVATNPQIVNGAQTSSVLRERRAHLSPGDVSVQARVIAVADNDIGRERLERISEFTNSQSPVRLGDLRANDRRHRTLQAHFGMLDPPVFYERRRGEWQSLDAAARSKFGNRRVTKEDIGQRYLAYRGKPAEAISNKDAIFGDLEAEAFDTQVSAQVYMLANDLYQQAEGLMLASNSGRMLDLVPGFSQQVGSETDAPTQLDTLRRARKLACAHATALAHEVLRWRYSDVGGRRAEALRAKLSDPDDVIYRFLWSHVFRILRQWLAIQPDKSAIKATLQRSDALTDMRSALKDMLVDADKATLPAL